MKKGHLARVCFGKRVEQSNPIKLVSKQLEILPFVEIMNTPRLYDILTQENTSDDSCNSTEKSQLLGLNIKYNEIEFPAIVNTGITRNLMSINQLVAIKGIEFHQQKCHEESLSIKQNWKH